MKHLRKISDYAVVGSLSALVAVGLAGCDSQSGGQSLAQIEQKKGAFVIIEEQQNGGYKILEEYPSDTTRIVLRDLQGSERILSQEEVDRLIKEEAMKIESGTSNLTNPGGMGLSLGETILASAAGAILGSYIGSKLFNNQNYQTQQRTTYKSPQAYERSQNSFKQNSAAKTKAGSSARGGFFGKSGSSSSNNRQSMGG